ncbi:MAG: DUF6470 family protein [Clostridiales bacterium]|nr:DUF6470 family protein [Clostridiales bacterium]
MITQLLRISTTPIKYELEIERARLEIDQDFMPSSNMETELPKLDVKTRNAQVKLNTYEARKSLGYHNTTDWYRMNAEAGMESISKTTRAYVEIGNDMSRIDEGITIADIFARKILGEEPILFQAFLPNTGADISWIPFEIDTRFQKGEISLDWETMRNIMNYVPGSVRMIILQQPSIQIEYLGGRFYFPPSADPEYSGQEE